METGNYVNGKFVDSPNKILTISPSTEEPISEVSVAEAELIEEALQAAWRGRRKREARKKFEKLKEILADRAEEIARLIAMEQGKPIVEALATEIYPSLSAIDFLLERGDSFLEPIEMVPHEPMFRGRNAHLVYQNFGVALVISPWNYPFGIPFLDIVQLVYAGIPVIFRPSTSTPLVGLKIGELFHDAGFSPETLQVLIIPHRDAEQILRDRRVSHVLFTGSVSVGRKIGQIAGEGLKKAVLELGGKDVMIILDDADIERAVGGVTWAGFMNAGQTCASVERVLVHRKIEKKFLELLREKVSSIKIGDPLEPETEMGPLISEAQRTNVLEQLKEAEKIGGEKVFGSDVSFPKGFYLGPHVYRNVPDEAKLWRHETFGPVVVIRGFESEEEAIAIANDSNYGLTASVWTRNRKRARRMAELLEAGVVTVNDHETSFAEPSAPWGGIKWSGIGRTHGEIGFKEALQPKYIMEDFSRREKLLWWFGYSSDTFELLLAASRFIYGRKSLKNMVKLIPYFPRLLREAGLSGIIASIGKFFGI